MRKSLLFVNNACVTSNGPNSRQRTLGQDRSVKQDTNYPQRHNRRG
jgi:hypothetical protein